RCRTRTVRAPSHGEGRDPDRVFGGRASGRRGTLADSALLWAQCRGGDAAARCALIERFAQLATRIARGMNVPVGAVAGPDDLPATAPARGPRALLRPVADVARSRTADGHQ